MESVLKGVSRKEIFAFQQWFKSLPKEETAFLYQTFELESVRVKKLQDLYQRYKDEKLGNLPVKE